MSLGSIFSLVAKRTRLPSGDALRKEALKPRSRSLHVGSDIWVSVPSGRGGRCPYLVAVARQHALERREAQTAVRRRGFELGVLILVADVVGWSETCVSPVTRCPRVDVVLGVGVTRQHGLVRQEEGARPVVLSCPRSTRRRRRRASSSGGPRCATASRPSCARRRPGCASVSLLRSSRGVEEDTRAIRGRASERACSSASGLVVGWSERWLRLPAASRAYTS